MVLLNDHKCMRVHFKKEKPGIRKCLRNSANEAIGPQVISHIIFCQAKVCYSHMSVPVQKDILLNINR